MNIKQKALRNTFKKAHRVAAAVKEGAGVKVPKGSVKRYVRDRLTAAKTRSGKKIRMYF